MENYYLEKKQLPFQTDEYGRKKDALFSNLPYFTAGNVVTCFENKIIINTGSNPANNFEIPKREKFDITKFSINSRRRFLKILSTINMQEYQTPLFITLTFHNIFPTENAPLKKILDNYLKRIKRINNNYSYVWRLELQKRGAPHFHVILFPKNLRCKKELDQLKLKIKSAWWNFIEDISINSKLFSVDIIDVNHTRQLFSYLSKYVCKIDAEENKNWKGRRWGCSQNINLTSKDSMIVTTEFVKKLRLNIYNHVNKKKNVSEEFRMYFFSYSTVEIFLSYDEQKELLNKTLKEVPISVLPHTPP